MYVYGVLEDGAAKIVGFAVCVGVFKERNSGGPEEGGVIL